MSWYYLQVFIILGHFLANQNIIVIKLLLFEFHSWFCMSYLDLCLIFFELVVYACIVLKFNTEFLIILYYLTNHCSKFVCLLNSYRILCFI